MRMQPPRDDVFVTSTLFSQLTKGIYRSSSTYWSGVRRQICYQHCYDTVDLFCYVIIRHDTVAEYKLLVTNRTRLNSHHNYYLTCSVPLEQVTLWVDFELLTRSIVPLAAAFDCDCSFSCRLRRWLFLWPPPSAAVVPLVAAFGGDCSFDRRLRRPLFLWSFDPLNGLSIYRKKTSMRLWEPGTTARFRRPGLGNEPVFRNVF